MAIGLLAAGLFATAPGESWRLPDRWNPWSPLDVGAAPNLLTPMKLSRASDDAPRCVAALATSGWRFESLPDTRPAPGCGLAGAVRTRPRLAAESPALGPPLVLSCPAALSLALWLRHAVAPAAERRFSALPVRLEHFGTYACRDVGGRPGHRSEHATADAIDVSGFVLEGGRRITVAAAGRGGDGRASGDADAAFLREVHEGACRYFNGVLGPDYNRAHADHFHLDRGPYRVCR